MNAASEMPKWGSPRQRSARIAVLTLLVVAGFLFSSHARASTQQLEAAALMSAGADAIELGQFDQAAVSFSNALDSGGLDTEGRALAHHHRGIAFQKLGQQDAAITDYTRAIESTALPQPVLARAYYNRGISLASTGQFDLAEGDYREVVSLAPDYAAAYHNLANLERRRHAFNDAEKHYTRAIELMKGRDRKLPLFGRALAREQAGDLAGAKADLQEVLNLDPEFEAAGDKLAALEVNVIAASAKPAAVSPETVEAKPTGAVERPRVLPAALSPFQTASSGNEGGVVMRVSGRGGWETTARRVPESNRSVDVEVGGGDKVAQADPDQLITGSLMPQLPLRQSQTVEPPAMMSADEAQKEQARFQLQLGAFRDPAGADSEWRKISTTATSLASEYVHRVQRADLGERGVFYRLRAGSFNGIGEARSACKAFEARKIACVVVES